ncbi:hypothetical protein [Bacillus alkalicellulosilyticus]|uniref:hypothetical protein n=1 Tax=Alkalihalobacterium alkalicellulosilyticum TaxID=1912214 RepID=UPI000998A88A|nr:hypothetical protein [Bacillus alkalicellulosilyticus]
MKNDDNIKSALIKFDKLLKETPDNKESVLAFKNFLLGFLRIKPKGASLPTVEVMTILKQEKPIVFSHLRKLSAYSFLFDVLTHIDMNPQKARDTLNSFKK